MLDSLIKMVIHGSLSMMKVGASIEQVPNLLSVFLFNTAPDGIERGRGRVPKMGTTRRRLAKSGRYGQSRR